MRYYQEHENIEVGINKTDMYELDKLILDKSYKEWCKCAFGRKTKNIHDMKIFNYMNRIHDNKINKNSECNSIHCIINPS